MILITGGAGYLGSTLALQLWRENQKVRVLDNLTYGAAPLLPLYGQKNFEFVRGDLRDAEAIKAALENVDSVIHLAAIVGDPACAENPDAAQAVNLEGSLKLFAAAKFARVKKFIFASTCSNYGKMANTSVLATEETELRPVSLYAETKVAVEQAVLDPSEIENIAATVLRFATLYGHAPRMRFDLTVNQFIAELLVKRQLKVFGEQFWRPYVHVGDAARAIRLILESPTETVAGQVFNVGDTQENFRKLDLVEFIQQHIGAARAEYIRRTEDPRDYRVSFERIREQLGFQITCRVADGIAEISRAFADGIYGDFENPAYHNTPPEKAKSHPETFNDRR